MPSLLFSSTLKDLNAQEDCGIPITVKDMSMLPSKTDQMKASQETGSDANIGFGRDLMPSYLGKHPLNAALVLMNSLIAFLHTLLGLVCLS